MTYKHSKISNDDERKDFCRLSIMNDGAWVDLPLIQKSSAEFLRSVIEKEIEDCENESVTTNPQWTGKTLRAYRNKSSLNAEEFAKILDVSLNTLYIYERSEALPTFVPSSLQYLSNNALIKSGMTKTDVRELVKHVHSLRMSSEDIKRMRQDNQFTQQTLSDLLLISRKQVAQLESYPPSLCQSLHILYHAKRYT